jgi:Protein of unknown function (DUF2726)
MNQLSAWGWPLGFLVLVAVALLGWTMMKRSAPAASPPKQRSYRLEDWKPSTMRPLTHGELRMMLHLRKALPECLLLPQIALARFMNVNQSKSYNQWFGSVGRRCVDFLVCSEQGDVLGVIQLSNSKSKSASTPSEGTQRKLKALEAAQITVWQVTTDPLPDTTALRAMVLPLLHAAEEHSQMMSMQHEESEWQATKFEARRPASAFESSKTPSKPVSAKPAQEDRWNQAWPSEEARSSEFLDEFGMIELPPLVIKGSGRSATGFTRG